MKSFRTSKIGKDLGVTVDEIAKFREQIIQQVKLANRNRGIIFRTFMYMDKKVFLNLYKTIVRPHFEHAA